MKYSTKVVGRSPTNPFQYDVIIEDELGREVRRYKSGSHIALRRQLDHITAAMTKGEIVPCPHCAELNRVRGDLTQLDFEYKVGTSGGAGHCGHCGKALKK